MSTPDPRPLPGPPPGQPERRQRPRRQADRLGLSVDGRRAEDRPPGYEQPDARAEQRHLVLYLAGHPARLAWLRHHVSRKLADVAAGLDAAGHREAAEQVARAAVEHRTGDSSP